MADPKPRRKQSKMVDAVIVSSGTSVPPSTQKSVGTVPGGLKPVGIEEVLTSDNPTLVNLLNRQAKDPVPVTKGVIPTGSPALDLAQELIALFNSGGDLSEIKDRINMHAANSQEKAELLTGLLASDDRQSAAELRVDTRILYNTLREATRRGDLSTAEALTAHSYLKTQAEDTVARVEAARQDQSKNVLEIVDKTNYNQIAIQKGLQQKFKSTTPQGREILRKLAFRATRIVTEQTTTTKTVQETVESTPADEHQPSQKKPKRVTNKVKKVE